MCQDAEDLLRGGLDGHRPVPDRDETHLRTGKSIKSLAKAGAAYRGWRIWLLVDDRDIEIVALDGSPLRRLRLDPTKDWSSMSRDITLRPREDSNLRRTV